MKRLIGIAVIVGLVGTSLISSISGASASIADTSVPDIAGADANVSYPVNMDAIDGVYALDSVAKEQVLTDGRTCNVTTDRLSPVTVEVTSPTTWYVDDDLVDCPDADFTKIQDAVDAASGGDTIIVYPGTYQEHVTLDKPLTVETDDGATIDGGGTLSPITITADGCTVSGFNITGSGSRPRESAGVRILSDYNTISGNTIWGNKQDGILLGDRYNTITNNLICENKGSGLYLNGDRNTIEGNTISGNSDYGIHLSGEDNTLRDNAMDGNGRNFSISTIRHAENDIDTSNTVDGKPIYYLVDEQDEVIDSDSNAGYVVAIGSGNITIKDLTLANNDRGVSLYACQNCIVDNITAQDNDYGLYLRRCSACTVQNCAISGNERGLYLDDSVEITLSSNHIEDNSTGIQLWDSDANLITDNTIRNNEHGIGLEDAYDNVIESNEVTDNDYTAIRLWGSDGNLITDNTVQGSRSGIELRHSYDCRIEYNLVTQNEDNGIEIASGCGHVIYGNTISENADYGIRIYAAEGNDVHHNNLIDNWYNAFSEETNSWDDGSEGNYWSDYEEKYPDAEEVDGVGIWDTPYEIPGDAGATDDYPLMEPYSGEWDPWAYDEDDSGYIEIGELLCAISDYIGGDITISQLLEVISLYINHTHNEIAGTVNETANSASAKITIRSIICLRSG